MDEYLGIIKLFAGNFAPRDWAFCNGQLVAIRGNTALFSILGTTYGGDGKTTFALPNFNGNTPVGAGEGPGLSAKDLGEAGGETSTTISLANMPAHGHTVNSVPLQVTASVNVGDNAADSAESNGNVLAQGTQALPAPISASPFIYDKEATFTEKNTLHPSTVDTSGMQVSGGLAGWSGNGIPISNMQPYLVMNFIICVSGAFPPRP